MAIERRLLPRFPVDWTVELLDPHGVSFVAQARNISLGGAGLQTVRSTVTGLAQSSGLLMPGDRVWLRFLGAPGAVSRKAEGFECRVKEVRRLSQDSYLVSLWYAALNAEDKVAMHSLVDLASR